MASLKMWLSPSPSFTNRGSDSKWFIVRQEIIPVLLGPGWNAVMSTPATDMMGFIHGDHTLHTLSMASNYLIVKVGLLSSMWRYKSFVASDMF